MFVNLKSFAYMNSFKFKIELMMKKKPESDHPGGSLGYLVTHSA